MADVGKLFAAQKEVFPHWEIIKDVIDQQIDLMLNYRQSGHPGGSRSKVHYLVSLLLGGGMRWDIRHPEKRFGDRFILVAGHTAPLVYSTLTVFNEALRFMHEKTGDDKYLVNGGRDRMMTWEDLLGFRNIGGLPGHVEMAAKNLFCKFNTGPSGHGGPVCAGEALALKHAGLHDVRVFGIEGEGGHTAGCWHETKNSAYGLGLDNLNIILDWNDYGIDPHPITTITNGTPRTWFESYGWHVHEAADGSDWNNVTAAMLDMIHGDNPAQRPGVMFGKTRKGRGYYKYDNVSHGSPHGLNDEKFWQCRRDFAEKYSVAWHGTDQPAPADKDDFVKQFGDNLNVALDLLKSKEDTISYLADRLVEIGDSVPTESPSFNLPVAKNPLRDSSLFDFTSYPESMWAKPGEKKPNRAGFSRWGSYINTYCQEKYGRPLFIVCSADLAGSTNIAGFGGDYDDKKNTGWYNPTENPDGVILPQGITEFANSSICVGAASVNLAEEPENEFNGFYTACSTYGSFSYLKYGAMRLYSQLAQDCELKIGKTIWVAGHSGPETAEDSRTHFGIFAPGVTSLFPDGHVIEIHPWEYNEVPVMLAAAMQTEQPIVALHLTRPGLELPDRAALGLASHFEAAKGAYVLRDYRDGQPRQGVIMVRGTMSTYNLIQALPEIDAADVNVKIVAVPSVQLFKLQPAAYQESVLNAGDRMNSTFITNMSRRTMSDWTFNPVAEQYALSSDWDDKWRPGGSIAEVCVDAKIDPESIRDGVVRFAQDFESRMKILSEMVGSAKA